MCALVMPKSNAEVQNAINQNVIKRLTTN